MMIAIVATPNRLWFKRDGCQLQISVAGQTQVITVEGRYNSQSTSRVDKIVAGAGRTLGTPTSRTSLK